MQIFADAARVIVKLNSLVAQFHGESLASLVSSKAADGLGGAASAAFMFRGPLTPMLQTALGRKQFAALAQRLALRPGTQAAAGVSVILSTITVVQFLEATIGLGSPHDGSDLEIGSRQFDELSRQLTAAMPHSGWQGAGAEAYTLTNVTVRRLGLALAALDKELVEVIRSHADWVNHTRLGFGLLKDALVAGLVVEVAMALLPPPAGPLAARNFGLAVATLGILGAAGMIGMLCSVSLDNAQQANALTAKYNDLLPVTGTSTPLVPKNAWSLAPAVEATHTDQIKTPSSDNAAAASLPGDRREARGVNRRKTAIPTTKLITGSCAEQRTLARRSTRADAGSGPTAQISERTKSDGHTMRQVQPVVTLSAEGGASSTAEPARFDGPCTAPTEFAGQKAITALPSRI
ncbi:EspA/EspE family type VII secretion system effector [Mycobacterium sp. 050134]|uniref:EspA/EspE family type VII secretion system effector n=1 Tax=Mycobacterium sp. 050134 TaxID=3096111 RepID=UPI002EDB4B89